MTARDYPDAGMDETVVYPENGPPSDQATSEGPDERVHPMTTPPQANGRYALASGSRPLDGYTIKRAIGRGGFGEVYYATSDAGKEVALKLILRNLDVESRGVKQCMNLKCHNLLQIFDMKTTEAGDCFVIMEYVAGPSLAQVLAKNPNGIPAEEARAWLRGLVEGVSYLHDHGIVHRDLKPANLFMEEGIVKIGDYGLAKLITPGQGTEHSESIGTCHYMAPEIASGRYDKPIDVYAIGVILHEMLTGRVPFDGESIHEVLMKHLTARPDLSMLAEPYRSIVGKALAKSPAQRPQSVYGLLPPEDAPKAPGVRFIGDPKTPATPRNGRPAAEELFRIEAEEPVFYIGPETRPPRPAIGQRLRAAWRKVPAPAPRPAPEPSPRRVVPPPAAVVPVAKKPTPPPAPPAPPPAISPQARLAETTTSMLWAAPAAAVLSLLASGAMGVDISAEPERAAFLFGATLLGAWGALIPGRALEGRKPSRIFRRGLNLAAGAAVGAATLMLAHAVDLGTLPGWDGPIDPSTFGGSFPLAFAGYFGLLSVINSRQDLLARDRPKRFRAWPVMKAGALGGLLGMVLPFPQPWGLTVSALTAVVVQSVSPWSEPAARYARYVAKTAKARSKVA